MYSLDDTPVAVKRLHARFEKKLEKYRERGRQIAREQGKDESEATLPKHSVLRALNETFFFQWWGAAVCKVLSDSAQATSPLLTRRLIAFTAMRDKEPIGKGVGYALGITGLFLVTCFFLQQFFYYAMLTAGQVNAVLSHSIYLKSLRVSNKGRIMFPNGKVTNFLSTDCNRIDFALQWVHFAWTFPVSLAICLVVVITNIGAPGLVGFGFLFVSLFMVTFGGRYIGGMRRRVNKVTDSRVSMMREILQSMKVIKFYSWEEAYRESVTSIRNREMKKVKKMLVLRNVLNSVFVAAPTFAGLLSFIVMSKVGHFLNPATVFSSLTTFNIIRLPLIFLPLAIITGSEALVAVGRIEEYLGAPEAQDYVEYSYELENAIEVSDGSFIWEKEDKDGSSEVIEVEKVEEKGSSSSSALEKATGFTGFSGLNFQIRRGEFIMIAGSVGSGKSSLLSAIAGMMKKEAGRVVLGGELAYCGSPWIHNATVEENITFGKEKDDEWYKTVLKCCSLSRDLEILPAGDQTEVGERGITLSGGQKARINLARAVYSNSSIVLLDDVLSAVDAHVGKYIMENCLISLLDGKTRLLATHQLSMLKYADRIIFLDSNGHPQFGTVDELQNSNDEFRHLMSFKADSEDNEEELGSEPEEEKEEEILKKIQSIKSQSQKQLDDAQRKKDGKLMVQEDRQRNSVKGEVYKSFIRHGGGILSYGIVPVLILAIVLSVFTQIFTNVWLSFWTGEKFPGRSQDFYIGLFVMFATLSAAFSFFFFFGLTHIGNNASLRLHQGAIDRILHAPMVFFDTSPSGRVLNRFTKDTDTMDNEWSDQTRLFLLGASNIIGVFILIIIYLPYFAIALAGLLTVFFITAMFYRASAREIKRMDSTGRSVMFSHFAETLNGVGVIKAYKSEPRFIARNEEVVDRKNAAQFLTLVNQRWLAIRLDMVGVCLTLVVTMLCATGQFNIDASSVGLVLSSLLQIGGMFSMAVREFATVENSMNSVERVYHYAYEIEQEAPFYIEHSKPSQSWPEAGEIEFENVTMSYQPDLPPVLKDISLSIKGGEKIGICGRTGAGKSSIMIALYRICELTSGNINIDNIGISTIGLHDLRSKLSIIPQDPVLFQGTIRSNIDPFNTATDAELWDALRRSWLIDSAEAEHAKEGGTLATSKFTLDSSVDDDGTNFSLGQRQLLALTRALVRKSQVLILDEATSSVDYETDSRIQQTIKTEFAHCTILCIAHRLRTILTYDRILVLDDGHIKEFDTPQNLYDIPNGFFKTMCDQSGITKDDF